MPDPETSKAKYTVQDEGRVEKQQEDREDVHRLCIVLQVSIVVEIVKSNFELNADADTETL